MAKDKRRASAPKSSTRRIILLGVLGIALLILGWALASYEPPPELAEDEAKAIQMVVGAYMAAMKAEDAERAYALLSATRGRRVRRLQGIRARV